MATSNKGKHKPTISEKFASYYDNVISLVRGNDFTGRRQTCQENPFSSDSETQLTGFKREKEDLRLKPTKVNLNRSGNRDTHRTSEYEVPNLILRRGQQFDITIQFQRDYSKRHDTITLKFVTGSRPTQSRGSVIAVSEVEDIQDGKWGFHVAWAKDKTINMRVCSGSDAIVGRYELFIDTVHCESGEQERYRHKHPDDIYVIFNPWNTDDEVYLSDEKERNEYVMAETGRIWLGTLDKYCVRPWNFGQFDYVSLIAALSLLDRSDFSDRTRGDPVLITRAICSSINSSENGEGLVHTGWSGTYEDGQPPYAWSGSPAILEEFLKTRKGVKYGQCWTNAAVATTLLRSLGIPSRCITCYRAVHDSDFRGPVNTHWSDELRPKTEMDDTLWSFHVWNEAWVARPDLDKQYDGWQAFDATPKDCSEGFVLCGPIPVTAIRKGHLHIGHDAKYIFAEIHGCRVHWEVDRDGNMEAFMDGREVGVALSTKSVGTISRQDVTSNYKYPKGSSDHVEAMRKASVMCHRQIPTLVNGKKQDVEFTLEGGPEHNGDVNVILRVHNKSPEGRVIDVFIGSMSTFYTGIASKKLTQCTTSLITEAGKETTTSLLLKCVEYVGVKETESNITAYVSAKVRETEQKFATVQTYTLYRPHLEIKTEGRAIQGQNFQVVVKLTNTLSVPLNDGTITVDGPGFTRVTDIRLKKPLEPMGEVRETVTLSARRTGLKEIVAVFHCREICNIATAAEIDIVNDEKNAN